MAEVAELMKELESLGNEQQKKLTQRHGAMEPLFGVSFQQMRTIASKLKRDHGLALSLWKTGNADARSLATLLVDPSQIDKATAEAWVQTANYYMLVDLVSGVVAKSPVARMKADEWRVAREEFVAQAGWNLVGALAMNDPSVPDTYLASRLDDIQHGIRKAPNRVRHAMNGALIAIGGARPALRSHAITVAKAIGKVVVDHGETGCVTPDAVEYIGRTVARAVPEGTVYVPRPSGRGRGRGMGLPTRKPKPAAPPESKAPAKSAASPRGGRKA